MTMSVPIVKRTIASAAKLAYASAHNAASPREKRPTKSMLLPPRADAEGKGAAGLLEAAMAKKAVEVPPGFLF